MTQAQAQILDGSKEWHAERMKGIGGSDAPAALGLSKWKTPYQLYLEKIGEGENAETTWEMERGKALEPAIRQHYADRVGEVVYLPKVAMVHSKYDFMRYNPDGLLPNRLAEFKSSAYADGWGTEGTDEIPQEYIIQVNHGMEVSGRDVTDLMVSIAGNKPKLYVVEKDKELVEMIIEGEAKFWEKVKNRITPDPENNQDVAHIYRHINGNAAEASAAVLGYVKALKNVRADLSGLEDKKEEFEVLIKSFMGENSAETLVDAYGNALITWKMAKGANRIDSERLRNEQPAIAKAYSKIGEGSRRFLVK